MSRAATSCIIELCGKKFEDAFFVNMASRDPFVTLGISFLCSCGYVLDLEQRRVSYDHRDTPSRSTHRLDPRVRDKLLRPTDGTRVPYEEACKRGILFAMSQISSAKVETAEQLQSQRVKISDSRMNNRMRRDFYEPCVRDGC